MIRNEKKLEASRAAADALKSESEESAFRPPLGQLGNSRRSCHQAYRRPKH